MDVDGDSRARLFERYHRADNGRPMRALGLGQYMSQAIVRASGGTISYAPAELGSVLTLELPLATQPRAGTEAEPRPEPAS